MGSERQRLITARALGLAAVVCRGHIEAGGDEPRAHEMYHLVCDWLLRTGAWEGLERDEALLVVSPPGTLTRGDVARALFRAEQMAVLAWALGVARPLSYDQFPHDRTVARSLHFLKDDAVARLAGRPFHDLDVVHDYARVALALEDRLRRFLIDGKPVDFQKEYGRLPVPLIGSDLGFFGLPIGAVAASGQHAIKLAFAAAVERASAARWLLAPTAPQAVHVPAVRGDA